MNKKLNILTIGDVHGFDTWRHALDYWRDDVPNRINDYDYIVFVGDYVDEFELPDSTILKNLMDIIELKKKYSEKIILLWGNHDIQYLKNGNEHRCSGYRPNMYLQLFQLFTHNSDLFQLAFQIDNYLWTHAGISKGWYIENIKQQKYIIRNNRVDKNFLTKEPDDKNLADTLNRMYELHYDNIYQCSFHRGGRFRISGPLWADKLETYKKPLEGYHQIVGHTRQKEMKYYNHYKDKNTSIAYVDYMHIDNYNGYEIEIEL